MNELACISTTTQAVSYLDTRFKRQLSHSEQEKAPPNTAVAGDSSAKAAFCALLMLEDQRAFFLKLINDRRYWPRLRSLVGSPPYVFLRPGDDGLLNASGIHRQRMHIASSETRMSSASDFGFGHFRDAQQRLYRVVAKKRLSGSVPLVGPRVRRARRGGREAQTLDARHQGRGAARPNGASRATGFSAAGRPALAHARAAAEPGRW